MTTSENNKRIAKNTLMLYFRMILTMLVSLYTSRVVLNTLGVEDYGTYTIVGGVVMMFGFLNGAMASATQRFLSFDLGREDYVQLRKTFNAAQITHFGIALLVLVLAETVGLWFVKNYLVIPEGRMDAAIWVYHFSVLAFMVTIIQVPYNATIIARERMDVYAYLSILEVILKLLIVYVLTWLSFDKLKLYGVLYFAVVFLIALIYRVYVRLKFEESKFELVKDKEIYKKLIGFSGWSLFGDIAYISKGQVLGIVLNMFFGTVVNAAQGIANQVQAALNTFASNFQMALNPQIIKSYAANEKSYMTSLVIKGSKYSYYLLLLLSLPIMIEIDYILKLWLKIVPEYTSTFTVLMLIAVLIDSMSRSLRTSIRATGKIKGYEVFVGVATIIMLCFSYILLRLGFQAEIVFAVNILIVVIDLAARLYFTRKLMEFDVKRYLKEVVLNNLIVTLLALIMPLILHYFMGSGIIRVVATICISVVWSAFVMFFVGLNREEKVFVISKAKGILKTKK